MRAVGPVVGFDPDRTRIEASDAVATTLPLPKLEAIGRGSLLAGKYRLELLLGEGGMGFVWSAYNVELELPVAIKLLRAGPKNAMVADRLRLEARAAARLVHPSIVRVFDIAMAENGDPFIVMELLTGQSLAELLARGPLNPVRAVQLLLPIAEGLALSHAKGVVHRDLKPDNVFVCQEGEQIQPKLLDFGIAKLVYGSSTSDRLTTRGTLLGSPNYMSPEQARGDEVDCRSDIWSFCVVLYEVIAGAAPFRGADKRELLASILSDEPRPLLPEAGVDEQLASIILCGLKKEPADRPASIGELGRMLASWLLANGVSEDACGAPLLSKWLLRPATPISGEPPTPPLRQSRPSSERVEADTLVSPPVSRR